MAPELPLLLAQLYARWLASDVKLTLLAAYPADHPVKLIHGAGTAAQRVVTVPLEELDRRDDFDHLTSLYVPPLPAYGSFAALQELVAHLRAPEGCPWDREQTLASLRKDLLEEAAEVLEAIDAEADGSDNSAHIAEELGDLYLVATMLTQIATEEGRFQLGDVMRGVVTKLIRRHPHVFGDVTVSGVDHVLANWDAIKVQEKAAKGVTAGPLDGVAAALPALEKGAEAAVQGGQTGAAGSPRGGPWRAGPGGAAGRSARRSPAGGAVVATGGAGPRARAERRGCAARAYARQFRRADWWRLRTRPATAILSCLARSSPNPDREGGEDPIPSAGSPPSRSGFGWMRPTENPICTAQQMWV